MTNLKKNVNPSFNVYTQTVCNFVIRLLYSWSYEPLSQNLDKNSTAMQCMSGKKGHLKISEVGEWVCPWETKRAAWLLMIRSHVESQREDFDRSGPTWAHRKQGNGVRVTWRIRNWLIMITRTEMDTLLEHLESWDIWMERFAARGHWFLSSLFIFAFSLHLAFCKAWQRCSNDFEAHLVA